MEIFKPSCFHLLLLLLLASILISSVLAIDPYSQALLSFKSDIIIDDSSSFSDWIVPSNSNPSQEIIACSWSGVKCDQNSTTIIGLDLSMKSLGGEISGDQFQLLTSLLDLNLSYNYFSDKFPTGIFNLTNLETLDVSRNNFSGHFPSGISNLHHLVVFDAFSNSFSGPLPAEISQIETLQVLNLAGSYFSGPIPSEFGDFQSLEFIHLAGNYLTGEIPPELGNLKSLTHMEIGYNSYQGGIPVELGNMSQLQYLDIAGANLSGPIPTQLSNLTQLESLFLFRNQLTGLIPWGFSNITTLTSLDLSDNQLTGPIPKSFSVLKNLRLLSLMYNNLNGTVPNGIAMLPQLETLLIWDNFFSGSLPSTLGSYSNLKWVDVSTNNFIGVIPPGICSRGVLFKLILFSNIFLGSLSPSLSNCTSLVRLRLEDNAFSGDIPLKFSNLPDISYVDLSRNAFSGGIPLDISQASNLQYFNVSDNPQLGGIVPQGIWSLPLLQNFSASSCNLTGFLPPFQSCKDLSVIELSSNHLSGNISTSVSNCEFLEKMDLSRNSFSGHLPEVLANLSSLAILDLSHNNFTGSIPSNFANSSALVLLNLSFNNLSGPIPPEKKFSLMGSTAFVGNPELCGPPLENPCSKRPNEIELGIRKTQKFAWVLIVCSVVVVCITVSVVGVLYFRKGSQGNWRMITFSGLPRFTAEDVLKSFYSAEAMETIPPLSASVWKAVLPTGITVSVKKIEVDAKNMKAVVEFVTLLGNMRHKNLVRLLGFCYNKNLAYVLYDNLPNGNLAAKIRMKSDWVAKYRVVIGIARGLCFLHHDFYPVIPHGDLRASNVVFDENMEPQLAEFGFKFLPNWGNRPFLAPDSRMDTGEYDTAIKEEIQMDIYNFGELILEVLTNGRLKNAGGSVHANPMVTLLREICHENDIGPSDPIREDIKVVVEVALLCTRSRPVTRPSMEDVLKLLSGLKTQTMAKGTI
ncbi:hypothetical protein RHMOL_Rhmol01G0041200 [Rhododendron molle]|uniref:Uncharacterized protein n=1 Tax=Rhododendron molle TaxID=49168 RepID=A0ACC0PYF7_RHOML|nr:hypothetical protein RHMOL_Rhmol01G0041200 [Rhododendron molle]